MEEKQREFEKSLLDQKISTNLDNIGEISVCKDENEKIIEVFKEMNFDPRPSQVKLVTLFNN